MWARTTSAISISDFYIYQNEQSFVHEKKGRGVAKGWANYILRDWVFSSTSIDLQSFLPAGVNVGPFV